MADLYTDLHAIHQIVERSASKEEARALLCATHGFSLPWDRACKELERELDLKFPLGKVAFKEEVESKYVLAEAKEEFHWQWDQSKYTGEVTVSHGEKEVATIKFWRSPSSPSYLEISYVGVPKEFRRGGFATKALKFLKKKAKAEGFKHISGEITWTGAYQMMKNIFGEPDSIMDAISEYDEKHLMGSLPKETPENEDGLIEDADYLTVIWKL